MKRILPIGLAVVVVLVLAGAGALYWFLSGDGIRRALEQQASAWLGQPVRIGAARATIFPRIGIALSDVQAGEPSRLSLQSVNVTTPLRPLLSRRIEDAEIILSGSRIELPLPFELPARNEPAPSPDENAGSDGGFELLSIRAITLRDIVIASRGHEITVSADSSLDGPRLTLEQFTASSGGTALEASGTVDLEPRLDARLTVTADRLDLDELMALAAAFTPPDDGSGSRADGAGGQPVATAGTSDGARGASGAPAGLEGRIAATLQASAARMGDLELQQLAGELVAEGNRVALSPLTFELFGGAYEGAITGTLGQTTAARIESRISDLDVAQLAAFGGVPDTVTGRLSASGTFMGQGADVAAAVANARGSGEASMVNGEIRHLDLVRTVVLFLGRPAPGAQEAASNRYDRIDLKFSLADRIFRADAFTFRSPDFDITGTGTLNTATKALAGDMTLLLSEELSAQAGTDLARFTREGNRIVLPATLGGTLESPRVSIDAKEALRRGLRNETERRLKGVLEGIFK